MLGYDMEIALGHRKLSPQGLLTFVDVLADDRATAKRPKLRQMVIAVTRYSAHAVAVPESVPQL